MKRYQEELYEYVAEISAAEKTQSEGILSTYREYVATIERLHGAEDKGAVFSERLISTEN